MITIVGFTFMDTLRLAISQGHGIPDRCFKQDGLWSFTYKD